MKNLVLNVVSGFASLVVAFVLIGIVYVFMLPDSMMADGMVPKEIAREGLMIWIFMIILALLFFYPARGCVQRVDKALSRAFKT